MWEEYGINNLPPLVESIKWFAGVLNSYSEKDGPSDRNIGIACCPEDWEDETSDDMTVSIFFPPEKFVIIHNVLQMWDGLLDKAESSWTFWTATYDDSEALPYPKLEVSARNLREFSWLLFSDLHEYATIGDTTEEN